MLSYKSSIEPELEKHKVDDVVTVDKKHNDNNNDIQRSEEENSKQQSTECFPILLKKLL